MTNVRKYALAGVGAVVVGGGIAVAMVVPGHRSEPVPETRQTAVAPPAMQNTPAVPSQPTLVDRATPVPTPGADRIIAPLPANAASVPDDDLLKLSALVNLGNAKSQSPDKAHWGQALPIAQRLLDGPCDCEQRNWLKHFVEMGGYAFSDSAQEYRESADVMISLGRNDHHAMAISHRPE